jgi:rare lipoprotein A
MSRKILSLCLLGISLLLAGCSSHKQEKSMPAKNRFGESLAGFQGKGSPYYNRKGPIPMGGGRYHVGKPYQVAGRWFTPKAQPGYDRTGAASWYGEAFHRRKTSNGEYFDMNALTAAHPTLPLPSYARVTNTATGKSIVVRINDRGPFVGTRIIDLSKKSAEALDFKNHGKAKVRVQWIGNAPVNNGEKHLAMMNAKLRGGANLGTLVAASGGDSRSDDVQVAEAEQPVQQVAFKAPRTSAGGPQIVQVGSFRSLEGAEEARRALSAIGTVQVYEWQTNAGPLYKVQMGPFSGAQAREALSSVQSEGYEQAILEAVRIESVSYQH